jgi:DNA polymerase II small subunit
MESIIQSFSQYGTFVQQETLDYILSKNDPIEFTNFITSNMKEYPLVLTIDYVKNIENSNNNQMSKQIKPDIEKEFHGKLYSKVFKNESTCKNVKNPKNHLLLDYDKSNKLNKNSLEIDSKSEIFPNLINIKKLKGYNPNAREYNSEIKIIKDVTGHSICEGTTQDLTRLFLGRYQSLKKILKIQRRELINSIPINRIKNVSSKDIKFIGIVKEVKTTTNGHRLIEVEDETGSATCIALKNERELLKLANEVVLDEIIGIRGNISKNGDLIVISNIIYPDISIQNQIHQSDLSIYAAFLSDIHIGSKQFMEKEWHSFLKWINGQMGTKRQRDVAGKIKYIVIPGDVVDGIGIYPHQEEELSIADVYRQYQALADQLRQIPEYISIIIQPGNHDAVRPAEPQPTFEKEIQDLFSGMDMTFVGNPCYFSLNAVEILSYHGQSLLDFATNIQHLKYNDPVEIMKMMLKKHHLAPTYGGYTPLAPEHFDYMLIDKIPDIFVTGHVHLAQISEYRGVKLVNASSWQSQTAYQKMLNFIPDSAKLPIVDLKTGNITMMDFNGK